MDFNINDYLRNKITQKAHTPESMLVEILQEYVGDISINNIRFNKGIVHIHKCSPQEIFHIKLHKIAIIKKAKNKNIAIRDII